MHAAVLTSGPTRQCCLTSDAMRTVQACMHLQPKGQVDSLDICIFLNRLSFDTNVSNSYNYTIF